LRPRSLAVLRYLVRHPGRLVTKAELRQQVWGGTHVSDTVLRVCVRDIRAALGTEGNALFMVNLVEHLVQQGLVEWREEQWTLRSGAPAVESLPEGVRQLIVRRIEALPGDTQRVLEAASVVGETFAAAAVAAGIQCAVEDVEAVCEKLVVQQHFLDDSGLTTWPDGTGGGSYGFRHVLYQQVLYERLGATRRMQLHRRIRSRLETAYGARAEEVAAQLARHCERGGETSQAVYYWQQAGDNAARRNAQHDAIAILSKGLALLATLPESPKRARRELTLQLALGELLRTTKGVGSPDVGTVYSRAYTLCQQTGETPLLPRVLWGLAQFQMTHGQVATAGELVQQLLDLAHQQPNTEYVVEGHFLLGTMAFYRGDFIAARTHLEQGRSLSETLPSSPATLRGGFVRGVTLRTSLARVLWALGYADQAQQRSQEALTLARQGEHLPSLAYAECFVGLVCQCRRDVAGTQEHADALVALAIAQQWPLRAAQGCILRGWALAMQGDVAAGVAHLRQGVESHAVGPEHRRPHWLAMLAEAYGRAGQPEAGLQVLAEAVTLMTTAELWWSEAEISRLQGELYLQLARPDVPQAEACFQQALAVARRQQARSLELRAALSLACLWQQQGQRQVAHALLAPLYGWFTEGFDTADLQEAKALLEDLGDYPC
jgi:predicted ATPase